MKLVYTFTSTLLLGLLGIHGAEPKPINVSKVEKREDGLFYQKDKKTPFSGSTIIYYKNGAKKEVKIYKSGKRHSAHKGWYENGKDRHEATWENGKQNGTEIIWSELGNKISIEVYNFGIKDLDKNYKKLS